MFHVSKCSVSARCSLSYFQSMIFRRSEIFWKIGAILVYNCYSEQPVCNFTKRRTQPPVFFGEIFENALLWAAASKQSKRRISKKTFLWTAASKQSKIPACNVIQFLTIKISLRILL